TIDVRHHAPTFGRSGRRFRIEQQPADLPVHVPAEVQPRDGLLASVAALRVGHPSDLVEPHFLRDRLLVYLGAQPWPAREDAGQLEGRRARGDGAGGGEARRQQVARRRGRRHLQHERGTLRRAGGLESVGPQYDAAGRGGGRGGRGGRGRDLEAGGGGGGERAGAGQPIHAHVL